MTLERYVFLFALACTLRQKRQIWQLLLLGSTVYLALLVCRQSRYGEEGGILADVIRRWSSFGSVESLPQLQSFAGIYSGGFCDLRQTWRFRVTKNWLIRRKVVANGSTKGPSFSKVPVSCRRVP
jgi:hypothetical protein